ncbi:hypothetical protein FHR32_005125 [Streptosporangium album]|uniref:Uncharacterized protein n=1 Tax=Streptosporangium album TaxID=47479 RepID=A0A7W7S027_9ACTN|nr:hypothetical protein [Streptosporangium album]MBB4940748.1 hypothetical protein [Streptosporangium album]
MPDPKPYLTYGVRDDVDLQQSPPYQAFMAWCADNDIPEETGKLVTVWNEDPIRAVLDVYVLDELGGRTVDENGDYITTPVTYTASTLPPIQNGS